MRKVETKEGRRARKIEAHLSILHELQHGLLLLRKLHPSLYIRDR